MNIIFTSWMVTLYSFTWFRTIMDWYFILFYLISYNHGLVFYTLLPGFVQSWIGTLYSFTWFRTIMDWYFILFYLVSYNHGLLLYNLLPGFVQSWMVTLYSFTWFRTIMAKYQSIKLSYCHSTKITTKYQSMIVRNQVKEYKVPIHDCTKPGKRV
jgi:hypothetical protein